MKVFLAGVATAAAGIAHYVNNGESATSCGTLERGVLRNGPAREPLTEPSDLEITASREETVVMRTVEGGPGPSGIELPGTGCWTLDLRWAGQKDRMRLAYRSDDPG